MGAALLAVPCMAQTDAPPPAPQDQTQGAPSDGYGGPRRGGPEHRAEMLQHELNLTPDQFTQVKALMQSERTQMEALRSNNSLSRDDMRSQGISLHQANDIKLRALLTPDQVTKYDAMQARMREHMQERQEGQAPPPSPGTPQP